MILYCKNGDHEWEKTGRGRPPESCPEHRVCSYGSHPELKSHVTDYEIREASKEIIDNSISTMIVEPKLLRTLHCEYGEGHDWSVPVQRGRPPRYCPEHSSNGANIRQEELAQEKKEKVKKNLQEEIIRLSARVGAATIIDQETMSNLRAAGGINNADEETVTAWLRANTILLHEVEAVRARERKLTRDR